MKTKLTNEQFDLMCKWIKEGPPTSEELMPLEKEYVDEIHNFMIELIETSNKRRGK